MSREDAGELSDLEVGEGGVFWHVLEGPSQRHHLELFQKGKIRFDEVKDQLQKQLRGNVDLDPGDGFGNNLLLPAHGGIALDDLAEVVRMRHPAVSRRYVLEVAMSARMEAKGKGRQRFVVAYQGREHHVCGRGHEDLADKELWVWLVDAHKLEVWPPKEVRQAILAVMVGVPRGWCIKAAGKTCEGRNLFPNQW